MLFFAIIEANKRQNGIGKRKNLFGNSTKIAKSDLKKNRRSSKKSSSKVQDSMIKNVISTTNSSSKECLEIEKKYSNLNLNLRYQLLKEKGCKNDETEALEYFAKLDKNSDGYITKDELIFEVVLDQNHDGQVSDKEVNFYMSGHENYDQETFLNTGWLLMKHLYSKYENKKPEKESIDDINTEANEKGQDYNYDDLDEDHEDELSTPNPNDEVDVNNVTQDNIEIEPNQEVVEIPEVKNVTSDKDAEINELKAQIEALKAEKNSRYLKDLSENAGYCLTFVGYCVCITLTCIVGFFLTTAAVPYYGVQWLDIILLCVVISGKLSRFENCDNELKELKKKFQKLCKLPRVDITFE